MENLNKNIQINYSQAQIQSILDTLDNLEIKGIANMSRIMNIITVLNQPFTSKNSNVNIGKEVENNNKIKYKGGEIINE